LLLLLQVYWDNVTNDTSLTVESARQSSEFLPSSQNDYFIEDLNPTYKLSVIIVTYSSAGKREESNPVKGQTYGTGM